MNKRLNAFVFALAAMSVVSLSNLSPASAQTVTGVAPVARTPSCNHTMRDIMADMRAADGTVTFRVLTEDERLHLQQRCDRGELHIPRDYFRWARSNNGDDPNVDTTGLDELNMLRAHTRAPMTCEVDRWGSIEEAPGRCSCPPEAIPVVVHNHHGCAATTAGAEHIARTIAESIWRQFVQLRPGESVEDGARRFGNELRMTRLTVREINERLDRELPQLRSDVNELQRWRRTEVDPALASLRSAQTALREGQAATSRSVTNLTAQVHQRYWRVGGDFTLLAGRGAPYIAFGPSLSIVRPFTGTLDQDGWRFVGRISLGYTTAPNVGSGASLNGAAGVGYRYGAFTGGLSLIGGALWTPTEDPRWDGANLGWYSGLGFEGQFEVTERFRIRFGLGGAGGLTTQVNERGRAGRVPGPFFVGNVGVEFTL